MYDIYFTKQAQKDAVQAEQAGFKPKISEIIQTVRKNPYEESQGFEYLKYDLKGACSRRITKQHRFVYEILPNTDGLIDRNGEIFDGLIKVISMWTHYHKK